MKNNYYLVALKHLNKSGNTFHSVKVLNTKTGKVYKALNVYGYDQEYLTTAVNLIKQNENENISTKDINVLSVIRVNTKKALKSI